MNQFDAPTSFMTATSRRLLYAATWIVLIDQHQGGDALHDRDDQRELLQRAEHREDLLEQLLLVDDRVDAAAPMYCSYFALNCVERVRVLELDPERLRAATPAWSSSTSSGAAREDAP